MRARLSPGQLLPETPLPRPSPGRALSIGPAPPPAESAVPRPTSTKRMRAQISRPPSEHLRPGTSTSRARAGASRRPEPSSRWPSSLFCAAEPCGSPLCKREANRFTVDLEYFRTRCELGGQLVPLKNARNEPVRSCAPTPRKSGVWCAHLADSFTPRHSNFRSSPIS